MTLPFWNLLGDTMYCEVPKNRRLGLAVIIAVCGPFWASVLWLVFG